jgi:uncharacterized membrane protein
MIRHTSQIRIRRPMAEVFAFLNDPANYPLWQTVMHDISATDGMQVGSHVTYTRSSDLGERLTMTIKITVNDGHHRMESVSVGGIFDSRVRLELAPASDTETIFIVNLESKRHPALPSEAIAALQYLTDERTIADGRRLKEVLESRADHPDHPPKA